MISSSNSDDKPPQNGFQKNQPKKKRRRSNPLSGFMKVLFYITLALTVSVAVKLVISPIISGFNCNGIGNCHNSTTNNNFHFPGVQEHQPQTPSSPRIDVPRQPLDPIKPVPSPQNLVLPSLGPTPTRDVVAAAVPVKPFPAQPTQERISVNTDQYVYSSSRSDQQSTPTQPDYVHSSRSDQQSTPTQPDYVYSSRPRKQPTAPILPENNSSPPSGVHSDPPRSDTAPPSNSPDGLPEPPATTGIVAIMSFLGWITRQMQPQDPEE